jgi:hypothetical protein
MASNHVSFFGSLLGLFRRSERRLSLRRAPERRFKPGLECCEERALPAVAAPFVVSEAPVTTGNFGVNSVVRIEVIFNTGVAVVQGTGVLQIDVNLTQGGTKEAVFNSGGVTNQANGVLEFDYTVGSGDLGGPPLAIGSSINNSIGGTTVIKDTTQSVNANTALQPPLSLANVTVDGVQPTVANISYNNDFKANTGLLSFNLQITLPSVATFATLTTSNFKALTVDINNNPIGSGLNSATTIKSVSLVNSSASGSPSFTTLTYRITVSAGNGIGRLGLFLVDSTINPTLKDSFGNVLAGLKPTTSTLFPANSQIINSACAFGASAAVAHNYHIIG